MSLLTSLSSYFITMILGYILGLSAEYCIWRCRTSRKRWFGTTCLILTISALSASGVVHRLFLGSDNELLLIRAEEPASSFLSTTTIISLLSSLSHIFLFCSSWVSVNTFIDVTRWFFNTSKIFGNNNNNINNYKRRSFGKLAQIKSATEVLGGRVGKNFRDPEFEYPKLIDYNSQLDLQLAFVFTPLATTFLSLLMIPGVTLLCIANAIEPPRECRDITKRVALSKAYPKNFINDELCVIQATPDSLHPIVKIVNLVMSAAMKNSEEEDLLLDDNEVPASPEAGAFALFNIVFSTMSWKYDEKRKEILKPKKINNPHHPVVELTLQEKREKLKKLAETESTWFENSCEAAIHECVHVRQQMVSTSVMSFLAVYLGQYSRNFFRPTTKEGAPQAYVNIAAEAMAFNFESYLKFGYAKEPPTNDTKQDEGKNVAHNEKEEEDPRRTDDEHYHMFKSIKQDFYYKWY